MSIQHPACGKIRHFQLNKSSTLLPLGLFFTRLRLNMKFFLFCACAILLSVGCNDDKSKVEALQKETENIHDQAMKDMAEMNRVAREIKDFMMSASMTPDQSATYTATLTAIGDAENGMMAWMTGYKSPSSLPAAEAMVYLREQKILIEKNAAAIKTATEAGKKLLPK